MGATAASAPPARSLAGEPLAARVCRVLADGRFHSGEELARSLGVSRSAIWKASGTLRRLGTTLHAVRNRGYRLAHASGPLDPHAIRAQLAREIGARVTRVDVAWSVPSTNSALLARPNPEAGTAEVLLAEHQSAGRGRRARPWLAPPGGAICLSLSWAFSEVPPDVGALGLAIGVCALRALRQLGLPDATLKWPNDLLVSGGKLGGVLIDLRAEAQGPACVVIGIGMNVSLGASLLERIARTGTAATDLAGAGLAHASRRDIACALIGCCVDGLVEFQREGLKPFLAEWRDADALRGRMVDVSGTDGLARGLARGIDLHGALLVETPQGVQRFISGDVTVRPR